MAAVFLMLLALAVAAPVGHAAPLAAHDPAGSISGVVTNGTHTGAAVAGQQVTLRAIVLSRAPKDAGTATTDARGRFTFSGLDTSGETTYEVYTRYQGGVFVTAPVSFGGSAAAAQTANLTIYDTTTDTSALRVSNLTVLISAVNKAKGLVPVGVFYTFDNTGRRAIAGSLTPPAGGGMPQGIVHFALPANAENLTLGAGFGDAQTVQIETGFAATATIPPGPASFALAFDLPYTGTGATLPLSTLYPTDRLTMLASPAYRIAAPGFAADTPISANGQQFQQVHVDNLAAGTSKHVELGALPEAGIDPDLRFGQVLPIGVALALLLALLLWLFAAQGNLGALVRLAGRPVRRQSARAAAQARNATRQRLLEALLDLDERRAAGAIGDGAYERRRGELRAELRALLAASATETSAVPSPVRNVAARPASLAARAGEDTVDAGTNGDAPDALRDVEAPHGEGTVGAGGDGICTRREGEAGLAPTPIGHEAGEGVGASSGRPPAAAPRRSPAGATSQSVRARRSRTTAGGGR